MAMLAPGVGGVAGPGRVDPPSRFGGMPETSTRPFGSLLTAMVTPMTDDGRVDLEAAAALAVHLVDRGSDGLVVNGTTGEAPTTHASEKADLIRAVVDAVGDRAHVLAGAGSNDTLHAVGMAEQAAEAGAHGLLVVSPYYSRPSQRGIQLHTLAVADATGLPVMLYDVPARTGVRYSRETLHVLAGHERVVAVKDATGDVQAATRLIEETGLAWYSGDDGLMLPFLAVGAVGLVSMAAHLVGPELARAIAEFERGEVAAARATVVSVLPAIDLIGGSGNGALRAKLALALTGVLPTAAMRLPQTPADDDEVAEVRAGLAAAGLLTPATA
jgi:4-hydroxy-tetrahydrodipicolinate synthase